MPFPYLIATNHIICQECRPDPSVFRFRAYQCKFPRISVKIAVAETCHAFCNSHHDSANVVYRLN